MPKRATASARLLDPEPFSHHLMAFSITYHHQPSHANAILPGIFQINEPQHTEWITPEGWDAHQARASFEAQHPGCTILRCDDIGNPYENFAHSSLA